MFSLEVKGYIVSLPCELPRFFLPDLNTRVVLIFDVDRAFYMLMFMGLQVVVILMLALPTLLSYLFFRLGLMLMLDFTHSF